MSTTEVNIWKRVAKTELEDIVGFQLTVHCYLNSIKLTPVKLKLLTMLGVEGEIQLGTFCRKLAQKELFTSEQGARNTITELQDMGMITKIAIGGKKKAVSISPDIGLCNKLPIVADIKIVAQ